MPKPGVFLTALTAFSITLLTCAGSLGARELDAGQAGFTMMPMTKAQVEAINWGSGEMTLRHLRIEDVNLDAGITTFRVARAEMLDDYVPDQPVYLLAERINGVLTVTRLLARHPE